MDGEIAIYSVVQNFLDIFWNFALALKNIQILWNNEREIHLIFQVELVCESADIGGTHWEAEEAISKKINMSY